MAAGAPRSAGKTRKVAVKKDEAAKLLKRLRGQCVAAPQRALAACGKRWKKHEARHEAQGSARCRFRPLGAGISRAYVSFQGKPPSYRRICSGRLSLRYAVMMLIVGFIVRSDEWLATRLAVVTNDGAFIKYGSRKI
jgi:hypothetical protein